jgi:hypothetical protein
VHRPAVELLAEENQRLRDELRRQRVAVAPPEPMSRRVGRAMETKAGQWGTLAGAVAIVVTAVSPIIGSWMDVSRLRAEVLAETAARKDSELKLERLELDARVKRTAERIDSLDAWRTLELERNAKREDAICKAGVQVPWRTELTCRARR